MQQITKNRSFKYLNQLAQSQQNSLVQAQQEHYRASIRWKLKSVNQLALSDPCFLPHLPQEKAHISSTVHSTQKMTTKISLRTVMNPESQGLSMRSCGRQMNHLEYQQKVQMEDIGQINKMPSEDTKDEQYCFDCDEFIYKTEDHICPRHLTVLQQINRRLNDHCITIASNKCDKLMVLSDKSCQISQSKQMTMLISFLRHGQIYYNASELLLRKRLINLCCKKLALFLEEEDRQ